MWTSRSGMNGNVLRKCASVERRRIRMHHTLAVGLAISLLVPLAACRYDMQDQPKAKTFRMSQFYDDRLSARPLVTGVVPQGDAQEDELLYTGYVNGQLANAFPFQVTRQVLERGRERFDIYCSPCHGRTGNGDGIVAQRGFRHPPSFHTDRLRKAPLGHFFDVMTHGFGSMYDYADRVEPVDRWAIIAYIRALQLSQNATAADVPLGYPAELSAGASGGQQ